MQPHFWHVLPPMIRESRRTRYFQERSNKAHLILNSLKNDSFVVRVLQQFRPVVKLSNL
jgi:hypothetical protein